MECESPRRFRWRWQERYSMATHGWKQRDLADERTQDRCRLAWCRHGMECESPRRFRWDRHERYRLGTHGWQRRNLADEWSDHNHRRIHGWCRYRLECARHRGFRRRLKKRPPLEAY